MTTHEAHLVCDHRYDTLKRIVYWCLLVALVLMVLVFGSLASERQRENEQLRADIAAQLLRAETILDATPTVTISCDRNHRIVVANKAAERVFGYRSADLVGKPINLLMPAQFHQPHATATARAEARMEMIPGNWYKPPKDFEGIGLTRDGKEIPLDVSVTTIKYGVTKSNPKGVIEFVANLRRRDNGHLDPTTLQPLPPVREEIKQFLDKVKT